jgi:peptidoglycan hydrolase-like protein with peptidoglycan-binding domain
MRALFLAAMTLAFVACAHKREARDRPDRAEQVEASPAEDVAVARPEELNPEQVRVLQRALAAKGQVLEVTGAFDEQTSAALKAFQRSQNLVPTGNLNFKTIEALGVNPADVMPVRGMDDSIREPQLEEDAFRPPESLPGDPMRDPTTGDVEPVPQPEPDPMDSPPRP